VRFKRRVDTYKFQGAGRWMPDPEPTHAITLPDDYSKTEGCDNYISVTKGSTMDLFVPGPQTLYPDGIAHTATFEIPEGTKYCVRSNGADIFVSNGKTIELYKLSENGFIKEEGISVPVGNDCKGIVPITYWTGYGYLKANSVDIFAFGSGSKAPYYKSTFTFPK